MKNYPGKECYNGKLQEQKKRSVLITKLIHVFAGMPAGLGIIQKLPVKRTGITMYIKPDIQQRIYPSNEQNEFQGFVIPRPVTRKVTADNITGPF